MPNWLSKPCGINVARLPNTIVKGAYCVAISALAAMMLIVGAEVVTRYIFDRSVPGHAEVVRLLMVFSVFLALAYAQKCGLHTRSTFLVDRLSGRVRTGFTILNLAIGMVFVGMITYQAFPAAWKSFQQGETGYGLLDLPYWPAKLALAIGAALFCVQYITDIASTVSNSLRRRPSESVEQMD
ncbi:MAG: TRAP transporter small permease [Chloroflexi bacterium]|nr:TRAP transporter small permease [Chloroflexota bacterium]